MTPEERKAFFEKMDEGFQRVVDALAPSTKKTTTVFEKPMPGIDVQHYDPESGYISKHYKKIVEHDLRITQAVEKIERIMIGLNTDYSYFNGLNEPILDEEDFVGQMSTLSQRIEVIADYLEHTIDHLKTTF